MRVLRCLVPPAVLALAAFAGSGGIAQAQRSEKGAAIAVPAVAVEIYHHVVTTGRPPAGYVGGRAWHNRERSLPPGGKYREFDIHPKVRGRNRGPERIIVDDATRRGWYTPDHYRTFVLIDRP